MSSISYMIKSEQLRYQPRGKVILDTSLFSTQELSHLKKMKSSKESSEDCILGRITRLQQRTSTEGARCA